MRIETLLKTNSYPRDLDLSRRRHAYRVRANLKQKQLRAINRVPLPHVRAREQVDMIIIHGRTSEHHPVWMEGRSRDRRRAILVQEAGVRIRA